MFSDFLHPSVYKPEADFQTMIFCHYFQDKALL